MAQKKTDTGSVQPTTEPAFSKEQLINCKKYAGRRDLVNALLDDNQKYTFSQVDRMIQAFDSEDFTENKERNGDE